MLTYKWLYGNIRHVKRKDVKTDRQTQHRLRINNQSMKKKSQKGDDKLKITCYNVSTVRIERQGNKNENLQKMDTEQKAILSNSR